MSGINEIMSFYLHDDTLKVPSISKVGRENPGNLGIRKNILQTDGTLMGRHVWYVSTFPGGSSGPTGSGVDSFEESGLLSTLTSEVLRGSVPH